MRALAKYGSRIAVTLIPVVLALLHATGVAPIGVLPRLDNIIYDARLRATMPRTLDERIVIVDIDEKSLAEHGRWPWSRNKLGQLVDGLFEQHQIALPGFDVVFAEADESSGLARLNELARTELKAHPGFFQRVRQLQFALDYDGVFSRALEKRPVVLGYYLTSDRDGRTSGVLPAPVILREALGGRTIPATSWNGYGANIKTLATAAPMAGFFNSITDGDGVERSLPLLAEYQGQHYESIALAMFRALAGSPGLAPGFSNVDERGATLVPFRGPGGAAVLSMLVGLNFWLYLSYGLVLPLASALAMALAAFALNMSYGYFVESRSKRELANLFGTYGPPELVDEMVKDPDRYSMQAAMQMADAVRGIIKDHLARGLPEIGIGIGLNTGTMCVGDMGSNIRRSYTVIVDAVNLGSRLEGLSRIYSVDIVVNETTRRLAPDYVWQELDRVRVKGKAQAVSIFWPVAFKQLQDADLANELKTWAIFLTAYRAQQWDQAGVFLINLMRMNAKKHLYQLYEERVASMRFLPFDPGWDGATNFETK